MAGRWVSLFFAFSLLTLASVSGAQSGDAFPWGTLDLLKVVEESRPSLFPRKFESSEIHSCLQSICGPASENLSVPDALAARSVEDAAFRTRWRKFIAPRIEAAIRARAELLRLRRGWLDRPFEKNFGKRKVSPAAAILLTVGDVFSEMSELKKSLRLVDGAMEWNQVAVFGLLFRCEDLRWPQEICKLVSETYAGLIVEDPKSTVELLVQAEEARERLKKVLKGLEPELQPLVTERMRVPEQLVEQFAKGKALSKFQEEQVRDFARGVKLYHRLFQNKKLVTATGLVGLTWFEARQRLVERRTALPLDVRDREIRQFIEKHASLCRVKLAFVAGTDVSELRQRKFREEFEALKVVAKEVASDMVELHLRGDLLAAIDHAELNFVATPDELARFLERLRRLEKEHAIERALLERTKSPLPQILAWMGQAVFEKDHFAHSPGADIERICSEISPMDMNDKVDLHDGQVTASWYSVAYPERGLSVAAHEIGHVVEVHMRRSAFDPFGASALFNTKYACVRERNPFNLYKRTGGVLTSTLWSREDWADHFGTRVIKAYQKKKSDRPLTTNIGCVILAEDANGYGINSPAPAEGDTHSSNFVRALMGAVDQGLETAECAPFLEYAKTHERALQCE